MFYTSYICIFATIGVSYPEINLHWHYCEKKVTYLSYQDYNNIDILTIFAVPIIFTSDTVYVYALRMIDSDTF